MFILETIAHETIWGGTRLKEYTSSSIEHIGHLYSLYCRENQSNIVLNGEFAGQYFNEIFNLIKRKYGMGNCSFFPLTIALVDADENLSIQVHPDKMVAREMEANDIGKHESWYFFGTPNNEYIFNGCKCASKEEVDEKLKCGKETEIIDTLEVRKGDYVYVEPGTLHAMTKGSFVYEIEEGSDFTYRFFDFHRLDKNGKERELHIEKAMYALKPELKSKAVPFQPDLENVEKTYATLYLKNINNYKNESKGIECLTIINGCCVCEGVEVRSGMTIVLEPQDKIDAVIGEAIRARYIGEEL